MEKLKTKPLLKLLSVLLILLLTASAASAAYSSQNGKYYSHNYNYKNCTSSEWNYNHSNYNQYSGWNYTNCNSGEYAESGICNQYSDRNYRNCNSGENTESGVCNQYSDYNQCSGWNYSNCNSGENTRYRVCNQYSDRNYRNCSSGEYCNQYPDWNYRNCSSGEYCNQYPDWNYRNCSSGEYCNQYPDRDCKVCNSGENTDPETSDSGSSDSGSSDSGSSDSGSSDSGSSDSGSSDSGSSDSGTAVPPVTPTDATGITTVRLCSNNVCTVGGNGEVLTLTNYNNAVNPTYDQLLVFLKADKTDEKPYTSTYVCSDFAKALHDNAEAAGIKAGWVGAVGADHAFNVFETTDKGTVYIDCTGVPGGATLQDKQLNVVIGQPLSGKYLFRQGTITGMEGTVTSLLVYW